MTIKQILSRPIERIRFSEVPHLLALGLAILFPMSAPNQNLYDVNNYKLPILSSVKIVDPPITTPKTFSEGHTKWESGPRFDKESKTILRIHFRVSALPAKSTWKLEVFDSSHRFVQGISLPDFYDCGKNCLEAWSDLVESTGFQVQLVDSGDCNGLSISLDRYNYEEPKPGSQSIIPPRTDLRDIGLSFPTNSRYRVFAVAVAELRFQTVKSQADAACSGVFVTRRLFVTNHHCISDRSQLRTAKIWANFVTGEQKQILSVTDYLFPENPDKDTEALDFSVLRLAQPVDDKWVARFDLGPLRKQDLIVIQHPNKDPKKITMDDCKVLDVSVPDMPADFFHLCDTDGGSSGSPVMTTDGVVVGLHHFGVNSPTPRNLAVKFSSIVEKIQKLSKSLYDEMVSENPTLQLVQ